MSRQIVSFAIALVGALTLPSLAAAAPVGALSDLPGQGACVTKNGAGAAEPGVCLTDPQLATTNVVDSVAVAPDGRFVYAADEGGLVLLYARDPQTGLLSVPAGTRCWRGNGSNGCADYRGKVSGDGDAIAISGDGRFLYAVDGATTGHRGVLVFARDISTGVLTQLPGADGCLTADGAGETGVCTDIRGPLAPNTVRLSADQRFVYVTDFGDPGGVFTFSRDPATGTLTQLPGTDGCITGDGSSEDGAGTCQDGRLVRDDRAVTLTPDGRHALVADFNGEGVEVFDRDPQTGVLTVRADQASCITQTGDAGGTAGACLNGRTLSSAYQVAVAPDGRTLYVAAEGPGGGVAVLRLDPQTGALTQPAGTDGCLTPTGADGEGGSTCTATDALGTPYGIVTGPDGRTLYPLLRNLGAEVFALDPATGLPSPFPGPARCVNATGDGAAGPGKCTQLKALTRAYSLTFAPDGATAYAADSSSIAPAVVGLRVEARPVCAPVSATTPFQTPVALTLPCSDPNGDPLIRGYARVVPTALSLGPVGSDGALTATPITGFSGTESFAHFATDPGGNTSEPATVSVTVGAAPAAPAAARDTTKPKLSLGRLRITKRGVTVSVTISEAAKVRATLKGYFETGDKPTQLARGSAGAGPGKAVLTLKLTKSGAPLRKLKGKRLKRFRATLTVTATDQAGNATTARTAKAKLTR